MQNSDDLPISGTGKYEIPTEELVAEESAEASGPLKVRLGSKLWKTKAGALEELLALLDSEDAPLQEYFAHASSSIADAHPGVQEKGLLVLNLYIKAAPEILASSAEGIGKALIEKGVSAPKANVRHQALNALLDLFSGLNGETEGLLRGIYECLGSKSIRVQTGAVGTVRGLIQRYGTQKVDYHFFMPKIEKLTTAGNAALRSEVLNFYKECYLLDKKQFQKFVNKLPKAKQEGLKNTDQTQLEAPAPRSNEKHKIRKNPKTVNLEKEEPAQSMATETTNEKHRKNIANSIIPTLLNSLTSSNWKIRKETIEKIDSLVGAGGTHIASTGLDVLFKALKPRLKDSNKSLVRLTLHLVGKLALALGPDAQKFSKVIVKSLLSNLTDKQSALRQDTVIAIGEWGEAVGAENIICYCGEYLSVENPELRTELLNWLLRHKEELHKTDVKTLIPGILSCLLDKTVGIRASAEFLFAEVGHIIGYSTFNNYLQNMKSTDLNRIKATIEKYRVEHHDNDLKKGRSTQVAKKTQEKINANAEIVECEEAKKIDFRMEIEEPTELRELDGSIKAALAKTSTSRSEGFARINDICDENPAEILQKTHELIDLFLKEIKNNPSPAFLRTVSKCIDIQSFIPSISEKHLYLFTEELLNSMASCSPDTLEALEFIILETLDRSDPTTMFSVLFQLLSAHLEHSRFSVLVINSALKLIEQLSIILPKLNVETLLLVTHNYLYSNKYSPHDSHTLSIQLIKTLLYELVKLLGESLWDSYQQVKYHKHPDLFIERWLDLMFSSRVESGLEDIFHSLSLPVKYNQAVQDLITFMKENPEISIDPYLAQCSTELYTQIASDLRSLQQHKQSTERKLDVNRYMMFTPTAISRNQASVNELKKRVSKLLNKANF